MKDLHGLEILCGFIVGCIIGFIIRPDIDAASAYRKIQKEARAEIEVEQRALEMYLEMERERELELSPFAVPVPPEGWETGVEFYKGIANRDGVGKDRRKFVKQRKEKRSPSRYRTYKRYKRTPYKRRPAHSPHFTIKRKGLRYA